jgi:hypothetical protein
VHTPRLDICSLYDQFNAPTTTLDCGQLCAPHNPNGKPFCCDTCYAVPVAYLQEWDYLQKHTDLWHVWRGDECTEEQVDPSDIETDTPEHMCLLACQGPAHCQRHYRSISCRQFPFFPYITADDRFIGMAYNWDFESFCWVISNLGAVTPVFRREFMETYDNLLSDWPDDYDSYYYLSEDMRSHFSKIRRRIPILHRNGGYYLLSPKDDRLERVKPGQFRQFGPFRRN